MFEDVQVFELSNAGHLPNDTIDSIDVVEEIGDIAIIEMSINSVDVIGSDYETILRVTCRSVHIDDPTRPGQKINI